MMIVCWHSRVGVGGKSYLGQYLLQAYHDFIVIIMSFSVMLQFYKDLLCVFCGILFWDFVVVGD
jgi:hypothetical protein